MFRIKNSCTKYGYAGYIDLDKVRDPKDTAKLRDHMTPDGAHLTKYGQIAVTDLIPEKAYGVNKELKDYAAIIGIDPYVARAVPETTTKAPANNNNNNNTNNNTNPNNNNNNANNNNSNEPTTNNGSANVIVPAETTTYLAPGIILTPETTTMSNANEILVDTPLGGDNAVSGNVSDTNGSAARQIVGFAMLAAMAMALIAVSAIMLIKMNPDSSTQLSRGGNGRANQKKKV